MANGRILVVEDEGIVARDIQGTLERRGYHVPSIASSGAEAIAETEKTFPDLALMDIRLKGDIDGVETARQIRGRFNIPVVYLTVYTDEHTLERVRATEPFGYLLKPFKETELCMTVQAALRKGSAERELKEKVERLQKDLERGRHFRGLGIFAATAAYELQNAFSAMKTDLLNMKQKNRNFFLDSHLVDMEQRISDGDRIVHNLLDYVRTTRPRYAVVSVMNILDESLARCRKKYPELNVTVQMKYDRAQSHFVEADPLHVIRLFDSILDNIFQAFANKEGDIRIELNYKKEENVCVLVFEDDGAGIDPEDLPRVFDPFFTRRAGGIGLGLTLCRQLADLYGGDIDVTSQKGAGTRLCLRLPITQTPSDRT